MDPLTHALTGGLVSQSLGQDRKRFWIYCFLGDAPDLDVFFEKLGGWAYFIKHRGFLHSLTGVIPQALLYAVIFSRLDKAPFRKKIGWYSLVLLLHVMSDFLTRHGAPLFLPFTARNFRGDLVPAVTVVMLIVMIIAFISQMIKKFPMRMPPKAVWIAWALYLLVCWSGKTYAMNQLDPKAGHLTLVPSNLNIFQWISVEEDSRANVYQVHVVYFNNGRIVEDPKGTVPMPPHDPIVEASKASAYVKSLFIEDRWPTARTQKTTDGWQVDWGTLLFSTRGAVRGKVRVHLDAQLNIIKSEHLFTFWNS